MVTHGEIGPWFSVDVLETVDIVELVLSGTFLKHIQFEGRSSKHTWITPRQSSLLQWRCIYFITIDCKDGAE